MLLLELTESLLSTSEWPLVWKTWKCQGVWNMSGNCQGLC